MKNLFIASTTLLGGLLIKQMFKESWKRTQNQSVPNNPASKQTSWTKAVVWTISTASLVGLARLAIRKGLTHQLEKKPR